MTASDQAAAAARVESLRAGHTPSMQKYLGFRIAQKNYSIRQMMKERANKGFEGRAAQSNSPVDCCDRERPSRRSGGVYVNSLVKKCKENGCCEA